MHRRQFVGWALAAPLAACGGAGPKFHASDITGADFARGFELRDTFGRRRTLADFKGKAVMVFFGYTHCPDVCPTTLADMAQAVRKLGADGARVQGVFVTVDPERDTPDVLRRYVAAFDPSFVGLYGTAEELATTAKEFKFFFQPGPKRDDGGSYEVAHQSAIYVFDPRGQIRLLVTDGGNDTGALVSDLRQLLRT